MFIYSVMLVPRLWVNPKSGLLNHQVMVNLVQETTVSLISQVDYLTCHRSDLSQMLRICDRWSCDLWMFLYRNVPCVSRLFLRWGSPAVLPIVCAIVCFGFHHDAVHV